MPKVSVIMPAYNSERYIGQALKSVLRQKERDLEAIVVNDGSTDGTLQIATALAKKDGRVRIVSQANSGKPSIARNRGIVESSGEFICFLDADDLFYPRKLEKQLQVFRQYPHLNLVFHDVRNLSLTGEVDGGSYLEMAQFSENFQRYVSRERNGVYLCNGDFYNFMSAHCTTLAIQNVMVRRSALFAEKTWFPEDMTIGEDLDLWFRLAMVNPIGFLLEPLSYYRRHENNITNDLESYFRGSLEVHEKNLLRGRKLLTQEEKKIYRRKIAAQHFHYGFYLYRKMEMKGARIEYLKSFRLNPSFKGFLAFLKTVVPANVISSCKYLLRADEA